MAPDSSGTELVTVVVAIIAAAALALFWNRNRGWRRIAVRGVSILACVVTSVAFAGSWVNRQVDFWPSWTGEQDTVPAAASAAEPDAPPLAGPAVAGPVTSTVRGSGRVVTVTVAGAASRLTMPMWVYLPAGYDPAGSLRYPVIEALHGFPGVPVQWLHALTGPQILDREIAAGRMAPTVVLFPQQSPRPLRLDTECTNLLHSAQSETFLTEDVPAYTRAHFRVRSDQSAWSLIGFSAGAYCAAQLLLRHPNQYAAAASLSGYLDPGIHVGDGSEHTTYNLLWRLQHLPVPAVALYLACARADAKAFTATTAIAKTGHNPLSLTTSYITGGGHSSQSWRAMEAPAFDWLSSWLGQPNTESSLSATQPGADPAPTTTANPTGRLAEGPAAAHP